MKRLIAMVSLSTALAIGTTACAHQQLTNRRIAEGAATAAVIAGLVLLASQAQCGNCNIGVEDPAQTALPPQR
jgi:hypothetical protein